MFSCLFVYLHLYCVETFNVYFRYYYASVVESASVGYLHLLFHSLFFFCSSLTFQEFVFGCMQTTHVLYLRYLLVWCCQMLLSLILVNFSFALLFCLHSNNNFNNKRRIIFGSLFYHSWQLSLSTLPRMKVSAYLSLNCMKY